MSLYQPLEIYVLTKQTLDIYKITHHYVRTYLVEIPTYVTKSFNLCESWTNVGACFRYNGGAGEKGMPSA